MVMITYLLKAELISASWIQGYMYVEAFKESHVMEAVRGLRNVLISKGAKLIPLTEMVETITVNTKAKKAIGSQSLLCSILCLKTSSKHNANTCGLVTRHAMIERMERLSAQAAI